MRFLLLTSIVWLTLTFPSNAESLKGMVIAVHDGDTLTLKVLDAEKKIRLTGIDAPELNQPFGIDSRNALRKAVLNREVKVEISKIDRFGRTLGLVNLDGQDINYLQVRTGMAWVYQDYLKELSNEIRATYLFAEAKSKHEGLGLWKSHEPLEPWIWRNLKIRN
jgi:endonuclease YncB( thermonuclease family)